MIDKVCVVIVIYDRRKKYLDKILKRLSLIGVQTVILVNNSYSSIKLPDDNSLDLKIEIINSESNLGSAGGFKTGIQAALDLNIDFIWLLDEDNCPSENALKSLLITWYKLVAGVGESKLMLCSYRPFLFRTLNVKIREGYLKLTPKSNGFLGMDILRLFDLVIRRFKKILGNGTRKKFEDLIKNGSPVKLDSSPYGGLIFHRSIKQSEVLPDEKMVLYWDDIEFTNRFHRKGGSIYLVPKSEIMDMDSDVIVKVRRNFFNHPIIDLSPSFKAYFYARNLIKLEKAISGRQTLVYSFNKYFMISILCLMCIMRGKMKRLRILFAALKNSN